ncbi:carboxymuconolactone decarboxylase family protein [Streptomyces sp. Y7]|uniref:carboxymuconolactone decarboxylase family protein n=1 Tax=Streptomyces sp. Y7 TaxID=3342392 RepID=UPI0037103589
MARIAYPSRAALPPEVAGLLDSMPRNSITEMLAHANALLEPFLQLAQTQFTSLELSARRRELVILAVSGLIDCEYEYAQHIPISEAAGIDKDTRERIRGGDFAVLDDPAERAMLDFVAAVAAAPRVRDEPFDAVRRHLTERQIVEVLQLVGFYWGVGRVCTVLDLEIDTPDGLESIKAVEGLAR